MPCYVYIWRLTSRTAGHYLNLPVVEEDGRLVGIVDVLKLTYATLEQVSSAVRRLRDELTAFSDRDDERGPEQL